MSADTYTCPTTCQCEHVNHDDATCGQPIQRDKHAHAQWVGAVCPGCAEVCFGGESACYLLPKVPCSTHEREIEADLAAFRAKYGLVAS